MVSTNPQWSRRDPRCRRRLQRAGGGCRSPLARSTQRLKPGAGRKGTERPWRDGNVRITPPPGVSFATAVSSCVGRPGLPELPSTEAAAAGSSLTTREAGALPRQPLRHFRLRKSPACGRFSVAQINISLVEPVLARRIENIQINGVFNRFRLVRHVGRNT